MENSECKDDKRLNESFVAIFPTMLLKKIRKSMFLCTIAYGTCWLFDGQYIHRNVCFVTPNIMNVLL